MFRLNGKKVYLRDFRESDIAARIRWETEETEWQLWDGPWEYEGLTQEQKDEGLRSYVASMHKWVEKFRDMPDDQPRTVFQICTMDDEYIGWVGSYRIDEDFSFDDGGRLLAVGIDIPVVTARGRGCASEALCLAIDYLRAQGEPEIYTQTWSGNLRMIGLAQKLGFEECCRKPGIRTVRGEEYDGLTFRLNPEKYRVIRGSI